MTSESVLSPPSLDEDVILRQPEVVQSNINNRKIGTNVDITLLRQNIQRKRDLITLVDETRRRINEIAAQGSHVSSEARENAKRLKHDLKGYEESLERNRAEVAMHMARLPNFTSPEVPIGPESSNKLLRCEGVKRKFQFEPRSHTEIGKCLKLLDMERGALVAGKGFYYLKNELVLIRQALSMLTLSHLAKQGFIPVSTPLVAREQTLFGTGYLPFSEGDNFSIPSAGNACLIGTSEQTLVGQHAGEIIDLTQGPIKYVCDSQCFRVEAGNYGKMNQGMLRVHQFGKVEQILICKPQDSEQLHREALENEEWLLKQLNLPYQVVLIASEDMGAPGYKKYDIEGWMPYLNKYVELTSNTNLTDFQTRRLSIRYRETEARPTCFAHTISATAFSDRLLVAILENYQLPDGSLAIPEILQPLIGKEIIKA